MTGRPRSFEMEEVLERAMDLFWKQGYEATGMSELTECMGIGRQSLYSTFGDKKQLFLKSLSAYLEHAFEEISGEFATATSVTDGLKAWLDLMVNGMCSESDDSRGCFALNSIVELCPDHDDVRALTQDHFQKMIGLVANTMAEGQATGEIRSDKAPEDLAVFLMTAGGGLIVASKLKMPVSKGPTTASFLLEYLRPPQQG